MHELSLVQGLLDVLNHLASERMGFRVVRAEVGVGRDGCCVPTTFQFLFDAMKGDWKALSRAELSLLETEGSDVVLMRVEMEEIGDV